MKKNIKISNWLVSLLILFITIIGSVYATQSAVDLGSAGDFVILAKSGISTTGTTSIVGDIGVSPIDSTAITGFGLIVDPSTEFATSSLIDGKVYASDYSAPTPSTMTTAIADMETAYTNAAGRTLPDYTELGAGDIGGLTLTPGLYKWGTSVTIPTDVTISGSSTDVWIFQIAQTLDLADGKQIILSGGARAENIFWQVGGQTTLGTTSVFNGVILSKTGIVLNTGSTLNGRALAQTAVTLDSSTVSSSKAAEATTTNSDTSGSSDSSSSTDTSSSSSSGSSSSGSSISDSWDCSAEWSECNSEGISSQTCTKPNTDPMVKTQSCTPNTVQVENKKNVSEKSENITTTKEETKNEIKSEVKSSNGNNLNGNLLEVKIMPERASEIALAELGIKVCSTQNNCTIELKTVGKSGNETKQYEMQIEKNSKLFGLFSKKMDVSVIIDAQTGDAKVHKPWWAFLAKENN